MVLKHAILALSAQAPPTRCVYEGQLKDRELASWEGGVKGRRADRASCRPRGCTKVQLINKNYFVHHTKLLARTKNMELKMNTLVTFKYQNNTVHMSSLLNKIENSCWELVRSILQTTNRNKRTNEKKNTCFAYCSKLFTPLSSSQIQSMRYYSSVK